MNMLSIPLLFALSLASMAQAATFTVTRLDDPSPDFCVPGNCSLRDAVSAADANNPLDPTDVIVLAAGNYELTRGILPLHQNLVVQGAGSSQTHVSTTAILFEGGSLSLELRGLSMQTSVNYAVDINDGTLRLIDVATPADGGVIHVFGDQGHLEIRDSDLRDRVKCGQVSGSCSIFDSQMPHLYVSTFDLPGPALIFHRSMIDGALNPADQFTGLRIWRASSVEAQDSTITRSTRGLSGLNYALPKVRLLRMSYSDNLVPLRFIGNTNVEVALTRMAGIAILARSKWVPMRSFSPPGLSSS